MIMIGLVKNYYHWLHGQWPAGTVEKLPQIKADGGINIPGVYIVGDLTGIPLLKFSADNGAKAVSAIVADDSFNKRSVTDEVLDLVIIGGGVSGISAALAAQERGLIIRLSRLVNLFLP